MHVVYLLNVGEKAIHTNIDYQSKLVLCTLLARSTLIICKIYLFANNFYESSLEHHSYKTIID